MSGDDPAVYVLDSFALLAFFQGEPGADRVKAILAEARDGQAEAWLSLISHGEMLYIIERTHGLHRAQEAIVAVDALPVHVADVDRALVFAAAHVKARHPISYADSFVVALAQRQGGVVVTGDPEFRRVENLVPIDWLPQAT